MNEIEKYIMFPTIAYKCQYNIQKFYNTLDEYFKIFSSHEKSVEQTYNMSNDLSLSEFISTLKNVSFELLLSQGYDLTNTTIKVSSLWGQNYKPQTNILPHVHQQCQLVGFCGYDISESTKVLFFDPRPGKVQINLKEQDINLDTEASSIINVPIKNNEIIITNSWLQHSIITDHQSNKNVKILHFCIDVNNNEK